MASTVVGPNCGAGPGAKPTDLRPCEYLESVAASSAQSLRSVFTSDLQRLVGLREGFHLDPLHARLGFAVRARDDGFIQGDLAQLPRLVFSADRESLPRGAHFEQGQQCVRTAHGVNARPDRARSIVESTRSRGSPASSVISRRSATSALAECSDLRVASDFPDSERMRSAKPARWIRQSSVSR